MENLGHYITKNFVTYKDLLTLQRDSNALDMHIGFLTQSLRTELLYGETHLGQRPLGRSRKE
jgi:hypothetical protein